MRILKLAAKPWTFALKKPFVISSRTAYEARNVQITLSTDDEAICGYGEATPVKYVTGETEDSVISALDAVAPFLVDQPCERLQPLLRRAQQELAHSPSARAGLEMALYDLWAKCHGLSLWHHFGGSSLMLITDMTIPLVPPGEAKELAAHAWAKGFRCFKIKVGDAQGPGADIERVFAILNAVPQATFRIDANQAFTPDQAVRFAKDLIASQVPVEMLEQPVHKDDWEGLRHVRRHSEIPVFADEAVLDAAQALHLIREEAVDGINIKLMKSGITGALEILSLCRTAGKKVMLGCMLESPLGIAAAAQIAAGIGAFDYIDLDSHELLAPVPGLSGGFMSVGGELHVSGQMPGWGVEITA